jgi:small subunit ribosomal protein S7
MSRRHAAEKREVLPDPQFGDIIVTKTINMIMVDGKRSAAERIFYGAMEIIRDKLKRDPLEIFHDAIENIKPKAEVRSRRVGGATYQVPVEVRSVRAQALALRWLVGAARKRNEDTMRERFAGELMDAADNRGSSVKKREDTHKMAEANKAFAHYRW